MVAQASAFVGTGHVAARRQPAVSSGGCLRVCAASNLTHRTPSRNRATRRVSCSVANTVADLTTSVEQTETVREMTATEQVETKQDEFLEVLMFCIPVVGSMISDPLMGVVDTACVGKVSTLGLAALGPAMNVYLFLANVFGFLGTSTAALIAPNQLHPDDSPEERVAKNARARGAAIAGMILATSFGVLLSTILLARTRGVLAMFGATGEILEPAAQYTAIRAFGITGMLLSFVFHGASMAQGDPRTPMIAFSLAGLVNLILDAFLIFRCNMDVAGAAIATTGSIYFGLFLMGIVLARRFFRARRRTQSALQSDEVNLKDKRKIRKSERLSPAALMGYLKNFGQVGFALLLRQVATMLTYSMLTFLATRSGTLALATHQVSLQLFWLLTFLPEALSVCGQTLVGSAREMPERMSKLVTAILKLAGYAGIGAALLTCVAHIWMPFLFTSDALVKAGMIPLTGFAAISQILCAFVVSFDGVAVGTGDIAALPVINAVSFLVTAATAFALCNLTNLGLTAVWIALTVALGTRLLLHLARRTYIKRKFGRWPVDLEQARKADVTTIGTNLGPFAA
eukprot:CAMPEP_0185835216 /NCGR_PEP_ID=MMETSP1353-20130828/7272_1 /TAXON_ID=1077150 /ORGANISM="Erythrolobus australicus, Strain CCMP3124" /LENGTH=571 /DNA_ID=CAMNT_0028533803 /DNA_START=179 /DNA_END=1891 /DNA_ORIENTATION=+